VRYLGRERIENPLVIDNSIARRFEDLPNQDILRLYQSFFTTANSKISSTGKASLKKRFQYTDFTPPWIRQKLLVAGRTSFLHDLVVPDIRNQRNVTGFQRMAWILASFYQYEPNFAKSTLDNLLHNIGSLRKVRNRKSAQNAVEGSSAHLTLPEKRRKRSLNAAEKKRYSVLKTTTGIGNCANERVTAPVPLSDADSIDSDLGWNNFEVSGLPEPYT